MWLSLWSFARERFWHESHFSLSSYAYYFPTLEGWNYVVSYFEAHNEMKCFCFRCYYCCYYYSLNLNLNLNQSDLKVKDHRGMLGSQVVDVKLRLKLLSVYMHDIDRPIASDHFVNRNKPFVKKREKGN